VAISAVVRASVSDLADRCRSQIRTLFRPCPRDRS